MIEVQKVTICRCTFQGPTPFSHRSLTCHFRLSIHLCSERLVYTIGIPPEIPSQELGRDVALTAGDIALAQNGLAVKLGSWGIPFAPCGVVAHRGCCDQEKVTPCSLTNHRSIRSMVRRMGDA